MSARPEDVIAKAIWYQDSQEVNAHRATAALRTAGLVIEQDWQPIETAPRDGRPMLATTFPKKAVFIVHWDGWDWVDAGGGLRDPTHYRPLPTPPEGQP